MEAQRWEIRYAWVPYWRHLRQLRPRLSCNSDKIITDGDRGILSPDAISFSNTIMGRLMCVPCYAIYRYISIYLIFGNGANDVMSTILIRLEVEKRSKYTRTDVKHCVYLPFVFNSSPLLFYIILYPSALPYKSQRGEVWYWYFTFHIMTGKNEYKCIRSNSNFSIFYHFMEIDFERAIPKRRQHSEWNKNTGILRW